MNESSFNKGVELAIILTKCDVKESVQDCSGQRESSDEGDEKSLAEGRDEDFHGFPSMDEDSHEANVLVDSQNIKCPDLNENSFTKERINEQAIELTEEVPLDEESDSDESKENEEPESDISDYEKIRLLNIKEFKAKFMETFGKDDSICPPKQARSYKTKVRRSSLKMNKSSPRPMLPIRRSARLSNAEKNLTPGEFTYRMYIRAYGGTGWPRPQTCTSSLDDDDRDFCGFTCELAIDEKIKSAGQRQYTPRVTLKRPVINPDEITDSMIDNICYKSTGKIYDAVNGSSCHQCRQKTMDTKSICRGPNCGGARGQFCGFCLKIRYGEDVGIVLKQEDWICPPCRGICNCSICRTREGKPPTGIMAPHVLERGYDSVHHLLESVECDKE